MTTLVPNQKLLLAFIWLALGLVVLAAAIAALLGSGPFIAPALLMLSVMLFMLSAQRTHRFAIAPAKFKTRIQFVAFAAAILSSLSIVLNPVLQ